MLLKIAGGLVGLYFFIHHTTGMIVGVTIGILGYKMYNKKKEVKLTENPVEKPPYPKLHKPDSTTIHFPKDH